MPPLFPMLATHNSQLATRHFPLLPALTLALLLAIHTNADQPPAASPPNYHLTLPDPLVALDGARVTTPDGWHNRRRPELIRLFEQHVYGHYPAPPPNVVARTLFHDPAAFDGAGSLREMEITFQPAGAAPSVSIYLLVAAPNASDASSGATERGFPCFVGTNFAGNHVILDDDRIRLPTVWMPDRFPGVVNNRATAAGRGAQPDVWPLAQIIARGYAVATFHCGDIQPDRPHVAEGLRAILSPKNKTNKDEIPAPSNDSAADDGAHTATIMLWAWGIHRAVDYLVTDSLVDPERIAVVGHSRLGKTALLAGALDPRIALTVANQAGCGGSGPSRHDDPQAETVARITTAFPHWFCKNFAAFGPDPTRLPIDQNCLVAISAPRPVLFTAAADDLWANPAGQFEVLKAASPVYELLAARGIDPNEAMPAPGAPPVGDRLAYWIRPGKHSMTPADWQTWLDYADRVLE